MALCGEGLMESRFLPRAQHHIPLHKGLISPGFDKQIRLYLPAKPNFVLKTAIYGIESSSIPLCSVWHRENYYFGIAKNLCRKL